MMGHGPARGGAFRGGFGGGAPGGKSKDFARALKRLLGRMQPEKWNLISAAVLGSISVFLTVIGPRILGNATDVLFSGLIGKKLPKGVPLQTILQGLRAHGQGQLAELISGQHVTPGVGVDWTHFGFIILTAVGVYLLGAVFMWVQGYIMAGVAQRTMYLLRQDIEDKLALLPLGYFDSHPHGDILSRVTNDLDNLSTTLQQGLSQLMTSVLTIVGVLIMMVWISALLAVVALVTIPLSILATIFIARRSQTHFTKQWFHTGELNGIVEESHTGHTLVLIYGRTTATKATFDGENTTLYDASFRAQFLSGIIQPTMQLISNLNYVIIAVFGGYRVASGTLTLGDIQAFIQYSRQFTMPITQLAGQLNLLQSGMASAERIFEFLDEKDLVPETTTPRSLTNHDGSVELQEVAFSYTPDRRLIEDFNLSAEPGKTVAIVGPTGAGKTTIVNLLMRFYEIDSGKIILNGMNMQDLLRDDIRREFGMVLQDTWLFSGSLRDNIAYGKPNATEDEIIAAATEAHVDHFIRTLPSGYDTIIDDNASTLSSGQRQLITIARAFLSDPSILILDEATSNVDTRTEILIQNAMAALRKGRTSFVIAHRLSTIRHADVILVMEHGHIVEQGNHKTLMERKGPYFNLYTSQFTSAASLNS